MPKLVTAKLSNNAEPCILRYTTSDNEMLNIKADWFDAKIVLHTYNDGGGQVIFNKPIRRIRFNAFYGCSSLTSVTIPNRVTMIQGKAFYGCSHLISATVPDSVFQIGCNVFSDCSSLSSVTIPDSVTKIAEKAFCCCSSLTAFYGKFASADNRCLIVDGVLVSFASVGLTEYTIPNGVTKIGFGAFSDCERLISVTIPNSVTEIDRFAFSGCSSLISVTIPNSVTKIGGYAFRDCSSLSSITIPDSVNKIGFSAFSGCSSLQTIICKPIIPPKLDSISGAKTFSGIPSYAIIIIPDGCEETYMNSDWRKVL